MVNFKNELTRLVNNYLASGVELLDIDITDEIKSKNMIQYLYGSKIITETTLKIPYENDFIMLEDVKLGMINLQTLKSPTKLIKENAPGADYVYVEFKSDIGLGDNKAFTNINVVGDVNHGMFYMEKTSLSSPEIDRMIEAGGGLKNIAQDAIDTYGLMAVLEDPDGFDALIDNIHITMPLHRTPFNTER